MEHLTNQKPGIGIMKDGGEGSKERITRRKAISTAGKVAVGLVAGGAVGGLAGYSIPTILVPEQTAGAKQNIEYKIGFIGGLTGSQAGFGNETADGVEYAINEFNGVLQNSGAAPRFRLIKVDDQNTPEVAVRAITSLKESEGVQVVISTTGSGNVLAMKSYVDANKIVLVGISSSPLLSVKDTIFRVIASDAFQGLAIVDLIKSLGVEKTIIAYPDNAYGNGVRNVLVQHIEGEVAEVKVTPGQLDYSSEARVINNTAERLGVNKKTAIALSLDETQMVNILSHIPQTFPNLVDLQWLVSDSITQPGWYPPKAPPDAADFFIRAKGLGASGQVIVTPRATEVLDYMKREKGHTSVWSLYSYDSTYIAMLSILSAGKYDGETISGVLPTVSASYNGLTGPKLLDEFGDLASQVYDIVEMQKVGDEYKLVPVGVWSQALGITFNAPR